MKTDHYFIEIVGDSRELHGPHPTPEARDHAARQRNGHTVPLEVKKFGDGELLLLIPERVVPT